ncbi:MAG TPA: hypothetical protein VIJ15_15670 [Dermatophilaceae bacterium]
MAMRHRAMTMLAVPTNVVEILRRRIADPQLRTDVTIFASPIGRVRDSSNTSADLPGAERCGLPLGVESHVPQDGGHAAG